MAMDSPTLQRRLRGVFDARVFNHGDYNLVYAQPSGGSLPHVIGYRHSPLEMLLCPVDPVDAVAADLTEDDADALADPATGTLPGVVSVALANVATVADTGTGYQVETVTGFRTWFEVVEHPRVPVGSASEDGTAELDQARDATDFHGFMTAFMDELDRLYDVHPDPDLHGPAQGV